MLRLLPCFSLLLTSTALAADAAPPVSVRDESAQVLLDNGVVSLTISKSSGNLLSLTFQGKQLLAEAAYLDWHAGGNRHFTNAQFTLLRNDGNIAELRIRQPRTADVPFQIDLHYVLRRGEPGPHMFAVFFHGKGDPAATLGISRWVMRLNDDLFDTLNLDPARRYPLPPSTTPVRSLGPKESLEFLEGPFKGQVTDKYHCYVDAGDHFFHGWTGTPSHLGCWMLTGSNESHNGGPTKQHNAAQWGRLLFHILTCSHYGAADVRLAADEDWQKLYGPWTLYCNTGPTAEALWKDAEKHTGDLRAAWPYDFIHHAAYPLAADRGTVTGQLQLRDPQDPATSMANAWVGLAAPGSDWQQQSDGYQFWVHADKEGRFRLPNVRPGTYTLYAFTRGVMDEFRRDNVTVTKAGMLDLGTLPWTPTRFGKQLWQIGIPDRTAAEFRHGDDYRHWGLWLKYPEEFPDDVHFTIGKSRERTDWNYAQVNVLKNNQWVGTTWTVDFDLPAGSTPAGTGVLRLALASTQNAHLVIALNNHRIDRFTTGSDNAMIRAGIHGQYSEQRTFFDAALLKPGANILTLTQASGKSVQKSILYDAVRLELNPDLPFDPSLQAAHPHRFPEPAADEE